MNTLKDYVNFRLTHADKVASAEAYPLTMEDCKKYKPMRDLKVYGNSVQDGTPTPETPIEIQSVGEPVTDETDANYGKYKIPVTQRGIHIVNPKTFVGGTLVDNKDGSYTLSSTSSNRFGAYNTAVQSIPIGSRIVINANILDSNFKKPRLNVMVAYMDNTISYTTASDSLVYNINVSKQLKYIVFYVHTDEDVGSYITFKNLMVCYADELKEYEPYIEPVTTNIFLDEPLRKLGDYADYIDFKENKVVRKCIKKYLENYTWNTHTNYGDMYSFWTEDRSIVPDYINNLPKCNYGLSNVFPVYATSDMTAYTCAIIMYTWASNVRVIIPAEYLSENSVSTLKSWLKENDVYMIRIRKTPIEKSLNIDLPKLTTKTTIIEINTSLAPSNAYGKYIKK